MWFLKLIQLLFRFVISGVELIIKLLIVFFILAFIFGVQASLVMTLILAVLISLIFINSLFSVLTEGNVCHKKVEGNKPHDFYADDYWTPGAPPVTQKAFVRGFFYTPKLYK